MADPKALLNPSNMMYVDTSKTVSQPAPVTDVSGLPVSIVGGGGSGTVATAALTSVNSAATSATLLAANANRRGVLLINTDANDLYVKYGATATVSGGGYTVIIPNGAYWEMPAPIFTGILAGIWAADGSGLVEITEL